jgi:transitional endoplasmic reticulum ATPase
MQLAKGTVIERRYRVTAHLRSTERGDFYQAADEGESNSLCLLRLTEAGSGQNASVERDDRLEDSEAEVFRGLNHSNVAKLRGAGGWGHRGRTFRFLAFDWVSGECLNGLLDRKIDLDVGHAFSIASDLIDALEYLHSDTNRILALNLHPSSVWLDYSEDQPKAVIVDLGLAVPAGSSKLPMRWGCMESFYIAPEVYNGLALPQSDVYTAGALLYRLIFGLPPWFIDDALSLFEQGKLESALRGKRTTPLDMTSHVHPLLDEHFERMMRKALDPDMEDRFGSVGELREVLRRDRKVTFSNQVGERATPRAESKNRGRGFADVAGMSELKEMLQRDVIDALNDRERYKEYGLAIPNGLLLYGPPGCGKTFIAEKFAEEIGCAVVLVTRSDIASIYVDGSVQKIRELFDSAKEAAPAILFFDEFESLVPDRGTDMHQSSRTEVNEFLTQLQGLSEHDVFVIAATNRPDLIDSAVLRSGRIDKIVFVPPPDVEAREAMFDLHLKDRPVEVGINDRELAESTANFVASDIKLIVDEAARMALEARERISQSMLEHVIGQHRPSISTEMIDEFERKRELIEGEGRGGARQRRMKVDPLDSGETR